MNAKDAIKTLQTIVAHRDHVRLNLLRLTHDLERRSLEHDVSKLAPDEFDGFTRINRVARENPYGSEEYRAGLRHEKPTIELHYSRNSHHPEHHKLPSWAEPHMLQAETMGFLDLIEMVCDWRAAFKAYGSRGTWEENMEHQRKRYADSFSAPQWWLINQVAVWLED